MQPRSDHDLRPCVGIVFPLREKKLNIGSWLLFGDFVPLLSSPILFQFYFASNFPIFLLPPFCYCLLPPNLPCPCSFVSHFPCFLSFPVDYFIIVSPLPHRPISFFLSPFLSPPLSDTFDVGFGTLFVRRSRIIASGLSFFSSTVLGDLTCLRICVGCPSTNIGHVEELWDALGQTADAVAADGF